MKSDLKIHATGTHQTTQFGKFTVTHYGPLPPGNSLPHWETFYQPFACVILNDESGEVSLIRDHLGVAPLYYWYQRGTLVFGETIPDVLKAIPQTPSLNENEIERMFCDSDSYSDETIYQGIYRVEPGHVIHIRENSLVKKPFWKLERRGPETLYPDEGQYIEHFSSLLNEALLLSTENHTNIAAEFSAGLDSTAIYCSARAVGVYPELYMHIATPHTRSAENYHDAAEKKIMEHLGLKNIHRIGAEGFEPLKVFEKCAEWFGGPAPYVFYMFAHNIHRAVSRGKHSILLSGFGGDQCVSGQLPVNFFLPELIHQRNFKEIQKELRGRNFISQGLTCARMSHPALFSMGLSIQTAKRRILGRDTQVHPYRKLYCRSAREAEWNLLQGPHSREIRLRIEYSSIVAKKMGFQYRYPLLYPKLLEFYLSIPTPMKRLDGHGRYLIRRYLERFLPADTFSQYRKSNGLAIVPSTFDLSRKEYENSAYEAEFEDLPYSDRVPKFDKTVSFRRLIHCYMLKHARFNQQ